MRLNTGEGGVYTPDDMTLLRQVFHEACATRGVSDGSSEAGDLARQLIAAFEEGNRDRFRLRLAVGLSDGALGTRFGPPGSASVH